MGDKRDPIDGQEAIDLVQKTLVPAGNSTYNRFMNAKTRPGPARRRGEAIRADERLVLRLVGDALDLGMAER